MTSTAAVKRRTTLALPAVSLDTAERLASKRNVNLSVVVGEALEEGLRQQLAAERADEYLVRMRSAFQPLTPEELLLVDGIRLSPDEESG